METSAKKLPSASTSLLLEEKPLANQEATVSAALLVEKSNTAQISGLLTQNPLMFPNVGSTSDWHRGKVMTEIRSGSSEGGCGRGWRVSTSLILEIIFKLLQLCINEKVKEVY